MWKDRCIITVINDNEDNKYISSVGQISRSEYVLLCAVRIGALSPDLVSFINICHRYIHVSLSSSPMIIIILIIILIKKL